MKPPRCPGLSGSAGGVFVLKGLVLFSKKNRKRFFLKKEAKTLAL
jgi:hypothetical protein